MASDHFTIVANLVARDGLLSNAAKGLFLNICSHRQGWVITEEGLASQCTDGVKKIRTQLLELRERGYVYRSQERSRYPAGSTNAAGKDISGALGPYTWFATDKPDEIAVILARYAKEQRAANLADKTAGQDLLPLGEVVLTSASDEVREQGSLPPKTAGSPDQAKHTSSPGRGNVPKWPVVPTREDTLFSEVDTTGQNGSSIEDQLKKTNTENETGGTLPPDPRRPEAASRLGLNDQRDVPDCAPPTQLENASTDRVRASEPDQRTTLAREEAQLAIRRTLIETQARPKAASAVPGRRSRHRRPDHPADVERSA